MQPPRVEGVQEAVGRIRHAKDRIQWTVTWADAASHVWRSLQGDERQIVACSPASEAAHLIEQATRDFQIVTLMRVMDRPGADRLSLPRCRVWLSEAGVSDYFIRDAERWFFNDDRTPERVADEIEAFNRRLVALETEQPNRVGLLRGFRNENIAHELHLDPLPPRPEYRHLNEILEEVKMLTSSLAYICAGDHILWQNDIEHSAAALWRAVSQQYPLEMEP